MALKVKVWRNTRHCTVGYIISQHALEDRSSAPIIKLAPNNLSARSNTICSMSGYVSVFIQSNSHPWPYKY